MYRVRDIALVSMLLMVLLSPFAAQLPSDDIRAAFYVLVGVFALNAVLYVKKGV